MYQFEQELLDGRVAVVTGAGSGLGAATAAMLSTAGARVALIDQALPHTASPDPKERTRGYLADITDEQRLETVFGQIEDELGEYGIRVMGIAPGVFSIPMTLNLPNSVFGAAPPFPKRPGEPQEFAALVLSIISNPMLNGEVIRIDGGLRLPAQFDAQGQ